MSDTEVDDGNDERPVFEGLLISKGIRRKRKSEN